MPRLTRPSQKNVAKSSSREIRLFYDSSRSSKQSINWYLIGTRLSSLNFFELFYKRYCKYLEYYSEQNSDGTYDAKAYVQLKYHQSSSTLSRKLNCRITATVTTIAEKMSSEYHLIPHKISFGNENQKCTVLPSSNVNPCFKVISDVAIVVNSCPVVNPICFLPQVPKDQYNPKNKIKLFN